MARPLKEGLDYFSLDVDMDHDDKIALIEAKHGLPGFALIVKLLMKIYNEGYFYPWTEREQLLFSKKVNVDINYLNDFINDCLRWGLFNDQLYSKYSILTSSGIQKRYLEASRRRKVITLIREYLLVDPCLMNLKADTEINLVSVTTINDNVTENEITVNIKPIKQSKVKQSKAVEHLSSNNDNNQPASLSSDPSDIPDAAANEYEKRWPEVQKKWFNLSGKFVPGDEVKPLLRAAKGDADLVMAVMDDKYRNYKPRIEGQKINSVSYFLQAIIDATAAKMDKPKTDGYDSLIASTQRALGAG